MFEERIDPHADGNHEELEVHALASVLQPLASPPVAPRDGRSSAGFQFPKWIWGLMLGCYGIFFSAIWLAMGGSGPARFAIVISVLYTAIYFGVARIGAAQAGKEAISPLDRGELLQTLTGAMDGKSVAAQVLIVPLAVALFGLAVAVMTAFIL